MKPLLKIAKVVFGVLLVLHGIAHTPGVWILEPRNLFVSLVVTTLWWKDAIAGLVINIGVLIILGGVMSRSRLQRRSEDPRRTGSAS